MRLELAELLSKLYVFRNLTTYDTEQWSVYSEEMGANCSAEVRLDGYADDIEAIEAQIIISYDQPRANMPMINQVGYIKAVKQQQGDFSIQRAVVNQEDKAGSSIYDWGNKSLRFFTLVAQELEKDLLPDFEELEQIAFEERGRFADRVGDGGRSPKINSEQLLKATRGF